SEAANRFSDYASHCFCCGGPGRTTKTSKIKALFWQTALRARTEQKKLFGALANFVGRVRGIIAGLSACGRLRRCLCRLAAGLCCPVLARRDRISLRGCR